MVTTKLSAMVQGFGYLIVASGPFAIGLLYDRFESYTYGIIINVVCRGCIKYHWDIST
ncbi:hypothetical protein [Helicobacter equorum]|uniref:hypothetical protein n=1 Tax=Helicobacter equorum TaxID=361872 RepID=UPI0013156980|nr:hypothetical protein [Helicobacter equorum]